jgi:hypothetical protein
MSIGPSDLWKFAGSLSSNSDEVDQRASISRAYYGAYHACLTWHSKLPVPGSNSGIGGGVHQQLLNQLKNPATALDPPQQTKSKSLGYMLLELKAHRQVADYELLANISSTLPAEVCAKAKLIIEKAA